jgi:hypothetical protein
MLKYVLIIVSLLIAGCATAPPIPLSVPGIERSDSVVLKDLRPPAEKERELFSLSITNDAYGMYRVADAAFTPPLIRVFQHRVFEKLGTGSAAINLQVHHFVVYRNSQAELRRSSMFAVGGIVGAALAGSAVKYPSGASASLIDSKIFDIPADQEYKRAMYTEDENPGRGSVYVIYIETEMQGKRVFSRTMAPLSGGMNAATETAFNFHLSHY